MDIQNIDFQCHEGNAGLLSWKLLPMVHELLLYLKKKQDWYYLIIHDIILKQFCTIYEGREGWLPSKLPVRRM